MFTLLSIHTFACDVLVLLGTESTESLKWLISFKQYMNIKWLSQCVKSSGSQCKPFNGFITFDCHVSCSLFCAGSVIEFCDAIITWSIHKWVSSTRWTSSEHLSLLDLLPNSNSLEMRQIQLCYISCQPTRAFKYGLPAESTIQGRL